jgi:hypothetical protein
MSLFAEVKTGCSSSGSSFFGGFGSGAGVEALTGFGGAAVFVPVTAPSPALPFIQTILLAFEFFVSRLQRTSPTTTTT